MLIINYLVYFKKVILYYNKRERFCHHIQLLYCNLKAPSIYYSFLYYKDFLYYYKQHYISDQFKELYYNQQVLFKHYYASRKKATLDYNKPIHYSDHTI